MLVVVLLASLAALSGFENVAHASLKIVNIAIITIRRLPNHHYFEEN